MFHSVFLPNTRPFSVNTKTFSTIVKWFYYFFSFFISSSFFRLCFHLLFVTYFRLFILPFFITLTRFLAYTHTFSSTDICFLLLTIWYRSFFQLACILLSCLISSYFVQLRLFLLFFLYFLVKPLFYLNIHPFLGEHSQFFYYRNVSTNNTR